MADINKKSKPKVKPSADREKLADNNKKSKPKDESIVDGEELANNNSKDPNNKPSADMQSLFRERNID